MMAEAIRVPRIPEFGGRIVRSETIPTNDEAIKPVAAGHVLAGIAARLLSVDMHRVRRKGLWTLFNLVEIRI